MDESERELQEKFIKQLIQNGYEYIELNDEDNLISNFEKQLRVFNKKSISNFDNILNYLFEGNLDSKFDKLRKPFGDINFIDFSDVSSNIFQVTQEIKYIGEKINYYDVTLLVNGIPLVQIELKKSGVELSKAFRQIKRYKKQSYSNLFDFVQIFIISNKVNTKYFLNEDNLNYNSTYSWPDNNDLESFTNSFLRKENIIRIISDYIFKDLKSGEVKMLKPYQIDVINKVKSQIEYNQNAYVWMSYNTGKSLTSLRLAELLKSNYKVIYLTTNHLSKYPSSMVIKNKNKFIKTFKRKNFLISNIRIMLSLKEELDDIKDEKIIFILNEYEKYNPKYDPLNLKNLFENSLFYCFTSAPIFDENLINGETTKFLFDNNLYSYSFKDALSNQENLNFEIEYVGDDNITDEYNLSSKIRIKEISKYILDGINEKTSDKKFKSILVTSSNIDLITYYSFLRDSDLKIIPILRYDSEDLYGDVPMGDYFAKFVDDYNNKLNASIEYRDVVDTSRISKKMEADIIKRFNNNEIDLLVIDESMLNNQYKINLLGNLKNDSINTIYLDCDLEYGSLFEVLTMVNQVGKSEKTCGNILTFRDSRENIDDALKLFSNNNASEKYKLKSYDYYLDNYNIYLHEINNSKNFIKTYEELSNNYYILERFEDFDFEQSQKDEFNKYKDKYEQELIKIESSKKTILKFCIKSIDHYRIDLKYINDLLDGKVTHETKKEDNEFHQNVNIVNNNQDLSKTVNIHIHVDNKKDLDDITNDFEINANVVNESSENIIGTANVVDAEISREKVIGQNVDEEITISNQNEVIEMYEDNTDDFIVKIDDGDLLFNLEEKLNENLPLKENQIYSMECNKCGRIYPDNFKFCLEDIGHKLINSNDFSKICPKCGMKYTNNDNYCHDDVGVELIDINEFPKICPECGRQYKESFNFCFQHPGVKLVKEDELIKYCPGCGSKYPHNYYRCKRCDSESKLEEITNINIKSINLAVNDYYNSKSHKNNIASLEEFFTDDNINKLSYFTFTQQDYDTILENIIKTHEIIFNRIVDYYNIDIESLSVLDRLLLNAKSFVKVRYKDSGADLGRFIFNKIFIDDRKPGLALEITTIIHELSHFLISEILEQIVMEVLDTYKTDFIEAFICYTLVKNDFNKLFDEFCAHSVEVKYTGYGYQDFSSYKSIYADIKQSNEYSNDEIEIAQLIGNTFADSIKIIFESFIGSDMRELILCEFDNINEPKNYRDTIFEIEDSLKIEDFVNVIRYILVNEIEYTSPEDLDKLQRYIIEFEKNNDCR